jgi:3-deoxy-D-manno-octulosonic-acid transferase
MLTEDSRSPGKLLLFDPENRANFDPSCWRGVRRVNLLDVAYGAGLALASPLLAWRMLRLGKYRRGMFARLTGADAERTLPPKTGPRVWLHAVSVGETLMLRPLIERLRRDRPELELVLSVGTPTGMAVAREKYPNVPAFTAPLDFSAAIDRTFRAVQPDALVLAELELWPNLLLTARRRGVPVLVANARMSVRSHGRYRMIRRWLHAPLSAIRWWGAQSDAYAERIRDLIPEATVEVTGSIKYEGTPTDPDNPATLKMRRILGIPDGATVLVAGSTQAPEEQLALDAWRTLVRDFPDLRLILVPRHRERFDEVAALLSRGGVSFVRRSALPNSGESAAAAERVGATTRPSTSTDALRPSSAPPEAGHVTPPASAPAPVILVDTIGELPAVWGLATLGLVGGSFDGKRGGQSMIEPAGYGVAVCFGPHVWNFRDTVDRLLEAGGAMKLDRPDELEPRLRRWLLDPAAASAQGERARAFIRTQQGAVAKTAAAILAHLQPAASSVRPAETPGTSRAA